MPGGHQALSVDTTEYVEKIDALEYALRLKVKDELKAKSKEKKSEARAITKMKVKDESEAKAEAHARRPPSVVKIDATEYVEKIDTLEYALWLIFKRAGVDVS